VRCLGWLVELAVELSREFTARRSASHHDKGEQSIAVLLGNAGLRSSFKALKDAIPYLSGVIQVLEKKDFPPLALGDTGCLEGIRFVASRQDEIIIGNGEFPPLLKYVFALHLLLGGIQGNRLGLVVL
jgi:hypothetical protein